MTQQEREFYASQVKRVRQELGLRQEDVAREAKVSRQTLSDIEKGSRLPQQASLERVMGALGISRRSDEAQADTRMWLGLIGGVLDALPADTRQAAGRDALNAATAHLVPASASNVTHADFGVRGREQYDELDEVASEGFDINPDPDDSNY